MERKIKKYKENTKKLPVLSSFFVVCSPGGEHLYLLEERDADFAWDRRIPGSRYEAG